ncbi:MAG: OmpA family protein [Kofleriaceae bacterium]|nr:OmpA family protein [Myxococcales bacterium]MCB9559100.1 OmpA family protein [Kofleriaceae bacterium]
MRTTIGIAGCIVALGASLAARPAAAQEVSLDYKPGFDPEQFSTSADPGAIALFDGARTLGSRSYAAGLQFDLGGPPLDICVRDAASSSPGCQVEGDIVNTRLRADLAFMYGFGKFDVRAVLPLVLHQSSDFDPAMGQDALGSGGVGDLRLGGRYQIAKPGDLAIAADLSFTLPTGGGDNLIGDSGELITPRILVDWRKDRLGFGAALGYQWRQDAAQIANLYVDDEITWSVGGEYWIQPDKLSAGLALFGRLGLMTPAADPMGLVSTDLGSEEFPAEALASARYFVTPKVAVDFGAGTAISSGYGAPPFRILLGVTWINRVAEAPLPPPPVEVGDADGDGIKDDVDQCVNEAEDMDGFADDDGCPEADNDADGILDGVDQCPNVAEDMDGFKDDDGCPEDDDDSDGDGVPDATDQCPQQPEDMDGFQDEDGCPDLDNDGDGIPDVSDQCPNEAEVFNGQNDDDGCPDEGRQLATVTGTAVEISDIVYFDFDKARIKSKSFQVLDAVVGVLNAHPDIRVRVEGHTDDQGTAKHNMELSQRRAEAVRDYLIKKGIDAGRLEAQGFGQTRPLAEGRSKAAREKNRRVEFIIIDAAGANVEAPQPEAQP